MQSYIEFPGFGWKLPFGDTIVEFSIFSIKWYGLFIMLGLVLAIVYSMRRAKYFKLDTDRMIDVVLVSTLLAFVGARLYYVVFAENSAEYFANPLSIFKIWEGGLAIYGGIIFAFLTGIFMCRLRKVDMLSLFDLGALGFLIGQGIGRWGNFFNQEAYGGITELPWRMNGNLILPFIKQSGLAGEAALQAGVHPTFLYESLWCFAGFILLHFISKRFYKFKGQLICLYMIWYGIGRFLIESLRSDSLYFGQIRVSQLVSGMAILGGIILLIWLNGRARATPKDLFTEDNELAADNAEDDTLSELATKDDDVFDVIEESEDNEDGSID